MNAVQRVRPVVSVSITISRILNFLSFFVLPAFLDIVMTMPFSSPNGISSDRELAGGPNLAAGRRVDWAPKLCRPSLHSTIALDIVMMTGACLTHAYISTKSLSLWLLRGLLSTRCVAKTFVMSEGLPCLMAFLAVLSEMSWGLHPWGLVFSATIGEALKGACEYRQARARARAL